MGIIVVSPPHPIQAIDLFEQEHIVTDDQEYSYSFEQSTSLYRDKPPTAPMPATDMLYVSIIAVLHRDASSCCEYQLNALHVPTDRRCGCTQWYRKCKCDAMCLVQHCECRSSSSDTQDEQQLCHCKSTCKSTILLPVDPLSMRCSCTEGGCTDACVCSSSKLKCTDRCSCSGCFNTMPLGHHDTALELDLRSTSTTNGVDAPRMTDAKSTTQLSHIPLITTTTTTTTTTETATTTTAAAETTASAATPTPPSSSTARPPPTTADTSLTPAAISLNINTAGSRSLIDAHLNTTAAQFMYHPNLQAMSQGVALAAVTAATPSLPAQLITHTTSSSSKRKASNAEMTDLSSNKRQRT
jgi:hypothetical protein